MGGSRTNFSLETNLCLLFEWQAVNFNTGHVVYDVFDDDSMRSQLDTRVTQLMPMEMLVSNSSSAKTLHLV